MGPSDWPNSSCNGPVEDLDETDEDSYHSLLDEQVDSNDAGDDD